LACNRTESFKLSSEPIFIEKLRDVAGLYLSPPDNALVICVDEKSQCQALERTQPMLTMGLGCVEGVIHDHKRHGGSLWGCTSMRRERRCYSSVPLQFLHIPPPRSNLLHSFRKGGLRFAKAMPVLCQGTLGRVACHNAISSVRHAFRVAITAAPTIIKVASPTGQLGISCCMASRTRVDSKGVRKLKTPI
jgi:hypothetical protein